MLVVFVSLSRAGEVADTSGAEMWAVWGEAVVEGAEIRRFKAARTSKSGQGCGKELCGYVARGDVGSCGEWPWWWSERENTPSPMVTDITSRHSVADQQFIDALSTRVITSAYQISIPRVTMNDSDRTEPPADHRGTTVGQCRDQCRHISVIPRRLMKLAGPADSSDLI
ncbi:hypothetical protein B0H11DRAFT_1903691 [Mycena galericulata]|nr:hypothetical protein B0H11DRAFT_1903691 [Mycena galericulata]